MKLSICREVILPVLKAGLKEQQEYPHTRHKTSKLVGSASHVTLNPGSLHREEKMLRMSTPSEWQKPFYDLLEAPLLTTAWHAESNTLAFAEHMLSAAMREACCSTWTNWHRRWLQRRHLNAFLFMHPFWWGKTIRNGAINDRFVKTDHSAYQHISFSSEFWYHCRAEATAAQE